MADFPQLANPPNVSFTETVEDSTVRAKTEGGYVLSRRKFTRNRRSWQIKYDMVPESEKVLLDDFLDNTVYAGALSFNWTHPVSGDVKIVKFTKLPEFSYAGANEESLYDVAFEIQEA